MGDYGGNISTNGEGAATTKGLQSANGDQGFRVSKRKVEPITSNSKKRRENTDFLLSLQYKTWYRA